MKTRREAIVSLSALGAACALVPSCVNADKHSLEVKRAEPGTHLTQVVRISRGRFPADIYEQVKDKLSQAGDSLIPAIKRLPGCLHYYAGVERESSTMVNVSIWQSLAAAEQMSTMKEMAALGAEFVAMGVEFERPIINYETVWIIG